MTDRTTGQPAIDEYLRAKVSPGAIIVALHSRQSLDEQQRIIDLLQRETNARRKAELVSGAVRYAGLQ